jgi:hypothetical protein
MANITGAIQALIVVFKPHCTDYSTLGELADLIQGSTHWRKAYDLFQRIRRKTLAAQRAGDLLLEAQYLFEESCAKTIHNLSGEAGPFDAYVPFSVVPNAFALARRLNISDSEIVQAIMF